MVSGKTTAKAKNCQLRLAARACLRGWGCMSAGDWSDGNARLRCVRCGIRAGNISSQDAPGIAIVAIEEGRSDGHGCDDQRLSRHLRKGP